MVNKDTQPWKIYGGTPFKFLKDRKKEVLKLQNKFENLRNKIQ